MDGAIDTVITQRRVGLTCLVTIHGIGFQHAPANGQPGYADGLHDRLKARLTELGGDPVEEFDRLPGSGAIYVHSDWPPASGRMEDGLRRLGAWRQGDLSHRSVDSTDVPLTDGRHSIAHVALVYAGLEEREPHLGASAEMLAKAAVAHGRYAGLPSLLAMGVEDLWAMATHRPHRGASASPGLQPDRAGGAPGGPLAVLEQLDEDVATYISRNDLRDRVRSFVHDALLRICFRDDVARVVVNAHSQGTVLAFDVIRQLPPIAAQKIEWFITAGSPLRKYADLFYWGTDAGCLVRIPWTNFWDGTDPVADPLVPPAGWRRGQELPRSRGFSEFYSTIDQDTGATIPATVVDVSVDNVAQGAGGGLPAHNYWENEIEFVSPLAGILRQVTSAAWQVPPPVG